MQTQSTNLLTKAQGRRVCTLLTQRAQYVSDSSQYVSTPHVNVSSSPPRLMVHTIPVHTTMLRLIRFVDVLFRHHHHRHHCYLHHYHLRRTTHAQLLCVRVQQFFALPASSTIGNAFPIFTGLSPLLATCTREQDSC